MKIVNFWQEDVCYMLKNNQIKIDRSDVWGEPQENKESLLAYCQKFSEAEDDETAHVVYLYGQGGVGKSFVCREIAEKLQDSPYTDKIYVISVDLQKQKGFEDDLKCLADEIVAQTGKKDIFPKFNMAYYNYKLKVGDEYEQEERSTKWDDLHNNSSLSLAAQTAGFFTSFGAVSDVIDLANEGYKWLLKMRDSVQYKTLARQIEAMDVKELREQLCRYFAADFCAFLGDKKNKKKKKFAFLLDTVESMRYQMLRSGKDEDYLEWLVGTNGLFRLLPGCFWMLFGREEIPWQNYDNDWEVSFLSREFTRPNEKAVREYLLKQFGQKSLKESGRVNEDLQALADTIVQQTDRYCLAIENCIDVYFRIWNSNLRKNMVTDENKADLYRPCLEEMKEMFLDRRGKKIISARFMQYYTPQEREVLYTLVCLGTWTEEILEMLIWRGSSNNILIYEEMCGTSFIQSGSNGEKSIQGLMLDVIMDECSQRLKKQLFLCILNQMKKQEMDSSYWLLFHSAVHIAKFYSYDEKEWKLLGEEFIRAVGYLEVHGRFYDLLHICQALLDVNDVRNEDEELLNAALLGVIFAHIFRKEDTREEYRILCEKECIYVYCPQVWKLLLDTAREVGAFEQVYEITALLEGKASAQDRSSSYYYMLLRTKVELMQELGGRYEYAQAEEGNNKFDYAQIEEEIKSLCDLTLEMAVEDPTVAEKINARFWAEYYYNNRRDLWGDIAPQRIQNCIERYSACCTKDEAEQDANLCLLKIMREKSRKSFDAVEVSEMAIRGMRILYRFYGDEAIGKSEMEFMFLSVFPCYFMPEEDSELLRKIFAAYYRKFSRGEGLNVFRILDMQCSSLGLISPQGEPGEGEVRFVVSDIIQQEILYLLNVHKNSDQAGIKLLLSYYLLGESTHFLQGSLGVRWAEELYGTEDMPQVVTRKLLNNRVLLYLLKQSVASVCMEKKEAEREKLCTLLGAIYLKGGFSSDDIGKKEKNDLLSLLALCGIDVNRILWKAEYAQIPHKEQEEKDILSAFSGWQCRLDAKADIQMANIVLYVAWNLVKTDDSAKDTVEKKIFGLLKERFGIIVDNERVGFWLGLVKEAAAFGAEYELHIRDLFREVLEGIPEKGLTEKTREKLAVYDTRFERRFESKEESGENVFDKEMRARLAEGDYDTARNMIHEEDAKSRQGKGFRFTTELGFAYFYSPLVKNEGTDGFVEGIQGLKSLNVLGGEYLVLRAYSYLDDKENFVRHYWENRQEIRENLKGSFWRSVQGEFHYMVEYIRSINEKELLEDYCRQYIDMCAEGGGLLAGTEEYTKDVLNNLEWLTEIVPFQEAWKKESCIKEIRISNYLNIYQCIHKYLSREELLDVFVVSVWNQKGMRHPRKTELTFFVSEYYQWLGSAFGEAAEDGLKSKFPELYAAREEYEKNQKDNYLGQMHKIIREIKDMEMAYEP